MNDAERVRGPKGSKGALKGPGGVDGLKSCVALDQVTGHWSSATGRRSPSAHLLTSEGPRSLLCQLIHRVQARRPTSASASASTSAASRPASHPWAFHLGLVLGLGSQFPSLLHVVITVCSEVE